MSILCPACDAQIPADSRSCPQCNVPLDPGGSTVVHRIAVMLACLLIVLTLVLNIVGWLSCRTNIDSAVMLGLSGGLLGLLLLIVGLIARHPWAWLIGLAHFELPSIMFALIWLFELGPRRAQPVFLWVDAVFLVVIVPLSIFACCRAAVLIRSRKQGLGASCDLPPASEAPRAVGRRSAKVARWLAAITLGIWLIGWLACWLVPKSGIALGLVNIVLSAAMMVLGLRGRYSGTWKMGIAHSLFFALFSLLVAVNYWRPREVRLPFIGLAFAYLATTAPLTLRIWRSVLTERHPMMCIKCGYLLYGLTEARCPECGTPFDPKLLSGPNPADRT